MSGHGCDACRVLKGCRRSVAFDLLHASLVSMAHVPDRETITYRRAMPANSTRWWRRHAVPSTRRRRRRERGAFCTPSCARFISKCLRVWPGRVELVIGRRETCRSISRCRSKWPAASHGPSPEKERIGRASPGVSVQRPRRSSSRAASRDGIMRSAPHGGDGPDTPQDFAEAEQQRWVSAVPGWRDACWRHSVRCMHSGADGVASSLGRRHRQLCKWRWDDLIRATMKHEV